MIHSHDICVYVCFIDSHVDPLPGNQLSQLYSITLEEDKIHDRMKENDASIVKLEEMLRKTQEQLEKRKELRQNVNIVLIFFPINILTQIYLQKNYRISLANPIVLPVLS